MASVCNPGIVNTKQVSYIETGVLSESIVRDQTLRDYNTGITAISSWYTNKLWSIDVETVGLVWLADGTSRHVCGSTR